MVAETPVADTPADQDRTAAVAVAVAAQAACSVAEHAAHQPVT